MGGRYLNGIPADSRIGRGSRYLKQEQLDSGLLDKIKQLNEIAQNRRQSLAQLALAWVLRDPHVSSAIIGASTSQQVIENVKALDNLSFSAQELQAIDVVFNQ